MKIDNNIGDQTKTTLCAMLLDRFLLSKWLPECDINAKFEVPVTSEGSIRLLGRTKVQCINFWSKLLWLNKVFYLPNYLPSHPPSYRQVAYLAILITILPKLLFPRCCNQMVSKTVTALIPAMAATFDMYYLRLLVIARFSYFLQELIFNPPPPPPQSPSLVISV